MKLTRIKHFLFIGLLLFKTVVFSQSSFSINLASDDFNSKVANYIKSNGVGLAQIIYGKFIYPDDPYKVNYNTLRAAVVKAFPDNNAHGLGIMDWEGGAFNSLAYKGSTNSNFKKALLNFQNALHYAKKLRPNVKWGFYGLPFRRAMYKSNDMWLSANNNISAILRDCGAFYPNFYRINSFSKENLQAGLSALSTKTSVQMYADLALSLAFKFDKPIYCLIWHRYMGHDPKYRFRKLSEKDFLKTISEIKKSSYRDKKINGIIWWSRDARFYRAKDKIISKEAPSQEIFNSNYNSMLIRYLNEIKSLD